MYLGFAQLPLYISIIFIILNIYLFTRITGIRRIERGLENSSNIASIIIPVRNNSRGVKRLINRLCKTRHELIIVDDESTDDTETIARKECVKCGCKYIRVRKPSDWMGKTYACWRGYLEARGDKIIFIDSDTDLSREVIDSLCSLLDKHDVVSLVPRIKCGSFASALFEYAFTILTWIFYTPWNMDRNMWMAGAIIGWRRGAYEAVGGHKRVYNSLVEDVALARIAYRHKLNIGFYSLPGHYSDMDYDISGLYQFMKRVSIFALVNPISYILVLMVALIATLIPIYLFISQNYMLLLIYLLTLYMPPLYLRLKRYILGYGATIILYPFSYIFLSILGFRALSEIRRSGGKIRVLWRNREVEVDLASQDTYFRDTR